jgi:amino acid adenylation domain-containing protein
MADCLAGAILGLNLPPNPVVCVCLGREAALAAAVIATFAVGGACVPMDPALPPQRRRLMAEDCRAAVVLTSEEWAADFEGSASAVLPVGTAAEGDPVDRKALPEIDEGWTSYIAYTSGSTGRPKGALIEYRSLVNLFASENRIFASRRRAMGEAQHVSHTASIGFDAGLDQLLWLWRGACLHLIDEEIRRDMGALVAYIEEEGLDVVDLTPSQCEVMTGLGFLEGEYAPGMIVLGGEGIGGGVAQLMEARPDIEFFNLYGTSECAINSMIGNGLSLDQPLDNTRIRLASEDGEPVAAGEEGVVWIVGVGVGRGYLDASARDNSRFVTNGEGSERSFRTGDIGREDAHGRLEIRGRDDDQAKVRGYRIEPGEIDAVLRRIPGLRHAAVGISDGNGGDRQIVAAVTSGSDGPSDQVILERAREHLPEYMVPHRLLRVDEMPLTVNGKLDRRAIAALVGRDNFATGRRRAQAGSVEGAAEFHWCLLLGTEAVRPEDDFFAAGGSSLGAARLIAELREELDLEIDGSLVFKAPRFGDLVAALLEAPPATRTVAVDDASPSGEQLAIWVGEQLSGAGCLYPLAETWWLEGEWDESALAAAFGDLVARWSSLRTAFRHGKGGLRRDVLDPGPVDFRVACLPRIADHPGGLADFLRGVIHLDPATGQNSCLRLFHNAGDRALLVLAVHHLVADDRALGILIEDLQRLYLDRLSGPASTAERRSGSEISTGSTRQQEGSALHRHYWAEKLDGLEAVSLPWDREPTGPRSYGAGWVPFEIPPGLMGMVEQYSAAGSVSVFTTLLSAFGTTIARSAGVTEVGVALPIDLRVTKQSQGVADLFVNTVVLRFRDHDNFAATTKQTALLLGEAMEHRWTPLSDIVRDLRPTRLPGEPAFARVEFQMIEGRPAALDLPGCTARRVEIPLQGAIFDLVVTLRVDGQLAKGGIEYATELFEEGSVREFAEVYVGMLEHLVGQPSKVAP